MTAGLRGPEADLEPQSMAGGEAERQGSSRPKSGQPHDNALLAAAKLGLSLRAALSEASVDTAARDTDGEPVRLHNGNLPMSDPTGSLRRCETSKAMHSCCRRMSRRMSYELLLVIAPVAVAHSTAGVLTGVRRAGATNTDGTRGLLQGRRLCLLRQLGPMRTQQWSARLPMAPRPL